MCMTPGNRPDARDIVNDTPVKELSRIFGDYGQVRRAGRVARAIERSRPLETTMDLVEAARRGGARSVKDLARVFQAVRIAVNDELDALREALDSMVEVLKPSGRAVVISYHSGEDSIVKRFFKPVHFGKPSPPFQAPEEKPRWDLVVKGALRPSRAEVAANSRSRSARLRAARRVVS
jgi:16S rRNA (cytosine1402-N4)-methyltransferase